MMSPQMRWGACQAPRCDRPFAGVRDGVVLCERHLSTMPPSFRPSAGVPAPASSPEPTHPEPQRPATDATSQLPNVVDGSPFNAFELHPETQRSRLEAQKQARVITLIVIVAII